MLDAALFHIRGVQAIVRVPVRDYSLQLLLWALWTMAVGGTAYWTWHAAVVAGQAFTIVGLAVHCGTVDIIGLIVLTMVEIKLQPERCLD